MAHVIAVAGKGGVALVGAVAKAGGAQGQHLPAALMGGKEKVYPFAGRFAKAAHAVFGGQGAHRQQNAGLTGEP